MSEVLPAYYYYPLLVFDVGFAGLFGILGILNPMQGFIDQLPMGYDVADKVVGQFSNRIALVALLGGVMGPVWAIMTAILIPLARNGMKDRPDLAEKVVRAHMLSGALIDPIHICAHLYYLPRELFLSPKDWHSMIWVTLGWLSIVTTLKVSWCLGIGRSKGLRKLD